jgi:hypothetical protein
MKCQFNNVLTSTRIEFINEFKVISEDQSSEETNGTPFAPEYVYDALRGRKRFDSMKVCLTQRMNPNLRQVMLIYYNRAGRKTPKSFYVSSWMGFMRK